MTYIWGGRAALVDYAVLVVKVRHRSVFVKNAQNLSNQMIRESVTRMNEYVLKGLEIHAT